MLTLLYLLYSCGLEQQLTPLHREIITLKLDYILKERKCQNVTIAANGMEKAILDEGKKKPTIIDDHKKTKSS